MQQMKTTRREVLAAAIALAVPPAVLAEAAPSTHDPPRSSPPAIENSSTPVLYKRSHCRGGWTLVSGTL